MTDSAPRLLPPDQMAREQALDASFCIIVPGACGVGQDRPAHPPLPLPSRRSQ